MKLFVALTYVVLAAWRWDLPPGFPPPVVPDDNPMSVEKVELGRRLFFDEQLSGNGTQSCASCHRPELAFTDGHARAIGSTGEEHPRSAMSLFNVAYATNLTWQDETLTSLEAQALVPLLNVAPIEMGAQGRVDEILARLAADSDYRRGFAQGFPEEDDPITLDNVARALASFERTLIAGRAPYFKWIYDDDHQAISPAAKRGAKLFFSDELACSTCHVGFTFSGPIRAAGLEEIEPTFHNTGLYDIDGEGRYPEESAGVGGRGAFRAPSLINIELTAPYMHDGSVATLSEVLDIYAAGGRGDGRNNRFKDERLQGFSLDAKQKADLLAFLHTLTDRETLSWYNDAQETSLDHRTAGDGDVDRRDHPSTPDRPRGLPADD